MVGGITPERVAETLRSDISGRRMQPGAALRQEELAARFESHEIPIREALRQLEADGIVVVHANRGAFVRSFSADELREIFDLRILLETDLLRRAFGKMTELDIARIKAEAGRADPGTNGRLLDRQFHEILYEPASRPHQLALVMKLRDSIAHYAPAEAHTRRLSADWMDDHRQIADACAKREADKAVRILRHHLEIAAQLTLGAIDRDPARQGQQKPIVEQLPRPK